MGGGCSGGERSGGGGGGGDFNLIGSVFSDGLIRILHETVAWTGCTDFCGLTGLEGTGGERWWWWW